MKALVLAGGKGTRLRPLTYTTAKQLIPVANRPIIHFVMDDLFKAGITEVGVIISPETGDQIKVALGENPWRFRFTYILQDQPLGLAHTILTARDFLGGEPFVMYLGDNLVSGGVVQLIRDFQRSEVDAAVLLKVVPDATSFGVAVVDEKGHIQRLVEKPREHVSDLALVGVYCFSPAICQAASDIEPSLRGELEITDAIQLLLETGSRVVGRQIDGWWLDCGKKDDILEANKIILDESTERDIKGEVDAYSQLSGRVAVDEGASIVRSQIQGPSVIGRGVTIRDSSIGPFSSVGSGCQIVESMLEHSVLLGGAKIKGVTGIQDSVIGHNALVARNEIVQRGMRMLIGDDAEILL